MITNDRSLSQENKIDFVNTNRINEEKKKNTFNKNRILRRICLNLLAEKLFSLSTILVLIVLGVLIYQIITKSIGWLDWQFLTSNLSIFPQQAGIKGAIIGTLLLMIIIIPVTLVLGVASAIYLEEYGNDGIVERIIKVSISNLASVPSVIFGLLGLTIFSRLLNLGSSILAGALTMSLLVLPIVVVSSQEALRSVPNSLREASYGMGANKWTTIWRVVLPVSIPGILTGAILAVSRAIGETAPLVVLGIPTLIMKIPTGIMDDFTVLPIQIYYWTLDTVLTPEYANLAAATIVVLLVTLFILNSLAIIIRNKFMKQL